jgi:serine/threonine-protein kinase
MGTPLLPTDFEGRAAGLAVSRYGLDRQRVAQAYQAAHQAQAEGRSSDVIDILVDEQLLTPAQAGELRRDLDGRNDLTQLDPMTPPPAPAPSVTPPGAPPRTKSGYFLRSLGEFRVLRRLGEGGMGTVFLGYDERNGRHVALKVLADQLANNPTYVARFHREARSGARFDHPNVVQFLTAGHDPENNKHYLVMEFVDGPSARALLTSRGKLAVGDAVHIALDILNALEHIHARDFVHRDIKPDNILLTRAGVAKLADLGLAKCLGDDTNLTDRRQGFGTPYYMPCEQALDATKADARCDLFALGASLYHLLTGEVPFPGKTPTQIAERKLDGRFTPASQLNPAVPRRLDRILSKMLARHPADRYQNARDLILDLEASGLNVPVPSFVFLEPSMQPPAVPAPASASEETQPDLETPVNAKAPAGAPNVWFLRYRDQEGMWCKSRATTEQVLDRLRGGLMPKAAEISRHPSGAYQPLTDLPEFRKGAKAPPKPKPAPPAADPTPSPIFVDLQELVQPRAPKPGGLLVKLGPVLIFLLAVGSGLAYFFLHR